MNKLNNKGFTLIEILAVVAMITIISLIAVPSVLSVINTGKDSSYEVLMKNVNTASKNLFEEVEYMDGTIYHYEIDGSKKGKIIIQDDEQDKYITTNLQTLVKNGFLEGTNDSQSIINPQNNEILNGCEIKIIKVIKDNKISYEIKDLSRNDICPSTNDYAI